MSRRVRRSAWAVAATLVVGSTAGCAVNDADADPVPSGDPVSVEAPTRPAASSPPSPPGTGPTLSAAPDAVPGPRTPTGPTPSDGRPRDAVLWIPALGVAEVRVVTYRGLTDDAAGTDIQDTGVAASPTTPGSGTGPGGVGNYIVTGHRNTAGGVFGDLPDLEAGDRVRVVAGGTVYLYEITRTRETSFRSPRSLREQRAPVPGRPGAEPSRAMITLSTCATQEDHAAGNYWADANDNPEHRIDKIGVLVATRPVRG